MISCHYCNYTCEDYADLARHVVAQKLTHRKGMKWASSYLLKVQILDQKKNLEGKMPLTEQEKENKVDCQRELSGRHSVAVTFCPICNLHTRQVLETEYIESSTAWRKGKALMVACDNCRK